MDKNFEGLATRFSIRTGKKNSSEWEWVLEILSGFELVVDSYEQPIPRPQSNEKQKKCYSGKQKRHTLKNQVVVMPSGREIIDVVVGKTGATADITIWRERESELSRAQFFQGDKAYALDPELIPLTKKIPAQL